MSRVRAALLIGAVALPASAFAQSPPTGATVPPIAFTQRTLANGLRVFAVRDTSTPNVAVQVWYDVGSKDDPKGRSGFAHMFEHLMFKATRNLVPEQVDRLTEDVGGYNNASTGDDYTNYFEVVPANHLQRLLFAEADRMASLVVEPVSFAAERDVVKEELRQRTRATPYGKLYSIYYPQASYSVHPYARPGVGSLDDLQAASIDDVRAFHATYYRPDNAILVVSGNFDPAQLDRWVDGYFAPIAKPDRPIPRVTVAEPARTQAVAWTVYEPNTPLPAVLVSYHVPPDRDADTPALTVLQAILATGESSRLYRSLVYRDQVAQSAAAFLDTKQSTGNFVAYAIVAGGKSVEQGEVALKREIARFQTEPVTAAELAEAKNEILTAAIRQRETAEGKAFVLASSTIVDGDPDASQKQLDAVARVSALDVQRVAGKYLVERQSATIRYLPIESKPAKVAGDALPVAATVRVADLRAPADVRVMTPALAGQRVLPPAPAAPIAAVLPRPVETRLANGMRVITVERRDLPIVTASLVATGGAATDLAGRGGASALASALLTKGTTSRSATEIARAVELLGGSIESGASRDGASIDVTVKSDQIAPAMAILADVAVNPAFARDEIERARAQSVDAVTVELKDPAQLARLVAARAVFGSAPYGIPAEGTPSSLKAITHEDVQRSYRSTWSPTSATLLMVGDITPSAAQTLAERYLGAWRGTGPIRQAQAAIAAPAEPRVVLVDMPGAGQAGVVVARPAIARTDARFYPLAVANTTLGGGFSSRLNQEIRIKRGLSYGATSVLSARRQGGLVEARTQTKNPTAPDVVAIIIDEMRKLGTALASAAELDTRKAVLVGGFGRAIETTDGIADILGDYIVQSVPLSELGRYTGAVQGVDPRAVQAAAAELLDPARASVVVVGDARQFEGALRRRYPRLEVIAASALNLDSPALR
ncbi:M16 family metallopeptidase [uncultured Sphingomonas sp.]|uniref:M16 family metallopeptidase n=1 Tax=uncultured Sphingomonas sp. TaxID=158754 RepID=UPI0035CB3D4F